MSDVGLQVLDGAQLSAADVSLSRDGAVAGARLLEIADARASDCLHGFSLPENLKSAAFRRLNLELSSFRDQQLDGDRAESFLRDYIAAIAAELKDEPLVVSVLDGNIIRLFLEDEDDFAMLAENLFTDLDTKDEGKLSKSKVRSALAQMGVEMGVPPLSEFSVINDILKEHGAEGEEKLGQAQFAQLLQPILQDVADALGAKHVTVLQNVKIINGSKLKKLLADGNQLDDLVQKMHQQEQDNPKEQGCLGAIRSYFEKNGRGLGLPPLEGNEAVILLYDAIFSDVARGDSKAVSEKSDFGDLVKQILQNFAAELEANPIFLDSTN